MTPKDFVLVIKQQLPEIAFEFAKFSQLYSLLEYQALDDKQKQLTSKAFKQSYKRIQAKLSVCITVNYHLVCIFKEEL